MGVFNTFGAVSGQISAKMERGQVAAALLAQLKVPGALSDFLKLLQSNGQGALVPQWVSAEATPAHSAAFEQVVKQSSLLADVASRAKMPIGIVRPALMHLLPIAVSQFARSGYVSKEGVVAREEFTQADLDGLTSALG